MGRREDFENFAREYAHHKAHLADESVIERACFRGCEQGYQYAVEKACEWLMNNVNDYIINDTYLDGDWYKVKSEMFDDFRKAMENYDYSD